MVKGLILTNRLIK